MNHDLALIIVGAGIALISSLITISVQHMLSMRAERIKRAWDKADKESEEFRRTLTAGSEIQLLAVKKKLSKEDIIELRKYIPEDGWPSEMERRILEFKIQTLRTELERLLLAEADDEPKE